MPDNQPNHSFWCVYAGRGHPLIATISNASANETITKFLDFMRSMKTDPAIKVSPTNWQAALQAGFYLAKCDVTELEKVKYFGKNM